jgi:protein O-GlcNAc transferase
MDVQRFLETLSSLYENWNLPSVKPKSEKFTAVLQQVEGMTTANIMQLLNWAVECLHPGEVYCEVGCWRGATLIGALLEHPDCLAYAIDDFSEFDQSGETLDIFQQNLSNFNLDEQVFFAQEDFTKFFQELQTIGLEEKIGVYFYDAAYNYRSIFLALLLVKPFLADQAILVFTNTNFDDTQQAIFDFTSTHSQSQVILDWQTPKYFDESFWNGVSILTWDINRLNGELNLERKPNLKVLKCFKDNEIQQHQDALSSLFTEAGILTHGGRLREAEQKYKTFLMYEKNNSRALMNLGSLYYLSERYQEAFETISQSLQIEPDNAACYYSLGLIFEKTSNEELAIKAYRQAIALNRENIDAYNNLGNILLKTGQLDEAEGIYHQAIKVSPQNFGSYQNLGNTLMASQKWDEAIETYQQALGLKPRDPDILYNLSLAYEGKGDRVSSLNYLAFSYYRQGNLTEAIKYFQQLLKITEKVEPDDYIAIATCLIQLDREEESIKILQQGINFYPDTPKLDAALISIFQESGRNEDAIAMVNEATVKYPDNLFFAGRKILLLPVCYETHEQIKNYRDQILNGIKKLISKTQLDCAEDRIKALDAANQLTNFYLAYQGYNDREIQQDYGEFIQKIATANYPAFVKPRVMPPLGNNGKIRIGYVSDQMINSSATKWILGWLQYSNPENFEIYCYMTSSKYGMDATTQKIRTLSNHFYYIPDNLEALAQQIIKDELHILVFLAIGMYPPTTILASLRLAPIQCTTWGHPMTSGLPTIDYFLSGDLLEPENAQEHYTETLVRLQNLGISYPIPFIGEPTKTRADFQIREDAVIYLSCQSLFKYLPQHDFIFAEIARQVPQAQFVFVLRLPSVYFKKPSQKMEKLFRQRLKNAFDAVNLNSEDYCLFLQEKNWNDYTSLLFHSDVFLDTLSFSGGHTSFDAVACHLPLVTCAGELMRGRQSYGILQMLGVTDTIAYNEAEYIDIAVTLGLNPQWRRDISQKMRDREVYLFDDKTSVQSLEQFYEQVVKERLEKQEKSPLMLANSILSTTSNQKNVLHVGCGAYYRDKLPEIFRCDEWREVRLDIDAGVIPDIIGSITDMSAVPNESVDAVYSSHNLEHVYHHEVPQALGEFIRVLKPGGFALITLPDIQKVAEFVAQGKLEETLYVSPAGAIAPIDIIYGFGDAIAQGNHYMAHRTGFTAQTLRQKMENAGFDNVTIRQEDLNLWATGYKTIKNENG